jgi:hypothetical protein
MKEIHVAFKIHTENSGVDLIKEDGETVNFGEGGDHTVDSIAKEITRQLKNLLEQRGIKLVDAVLAHSEEDNVIDNLLTGVRLGSFNKQEQSVSIPSAFSVTPIPSEKPTLSITVNNGEPISEPSEEKQEEGGESKGVSDFNKVDENVIVSNADSASATE